MNIHEYQAKQVLEAYQVPVPRGHVAFTPDDAVKAAEIANTANVDTLVFNHFAPPPANAIAARIFMRGVKDVRPQGAVMSDDGMRITLPPKTGNAPGIIEISSN